MRDRLSLSDAIHAIADRLVQLGTTPFESLFSSSRVRSDVVILFLALLELCKLKLIRLSQDPESLHILVSPRPDALERWAPLQNDAVREASRDYT